MWATVISTRIPLSDLTWDSVVRHTQRGQSVCGARQLEWAKTSLRRGLSSPREICFTVDPYKIRGVNYAKEFMLAAGV